MEGTAGFISWFYPLSVLLDSIMAPVELAPSPPWSWLMGLGMGIWEFVFRMENQDSLSQAAEDVKRWNSSWRKLVFRKRDKES